MYYKSFGRIFARGFGKCNSKSYYKSIENLSIKFAGIGISSKEAEGL